MEFNKWIKIWANQETIRISISNLSPKDKLIFDLLVANGSRVYIRNPSSFMCVELIWHDKLKQWKTFSLSFDMNFSFR